MRHWVAATLSRTRVVGRARRPARPRQSQRRHERGGVGVGAHQHADVGGGHRGGCRPRPRGRRCGPRSSRRTTSATQVVAGPRRWPPGPRARRSTVRNWSGAASGDGVDEAVAAVVGVGRARPAGTRPTGRRRRSPAKRCSSASSSARVGAPVGVEAGDRGRPGPGRRGRRRARPSGTGRSTASGRRRPPPWPGSGPSRNAGRKMSHCTRSVSWNSSIITTRTAAGARPGWPRRGGRCSSSRASTRRLSKVRRRRRGPAAQHLGHDVLDEVGDDVDRARPARGGRPSVSRRGRGGTSRRRACAAAAAPPRPTLSGSAGHSPSAPKRSRKRSLTTSSTSESSAVKVTSTPELAAGGHAPGSRTRGWWRWWRRRTRRGRGPARSRRSGALVGVGQQEARSRRRCSAAPVSRWCSASASLARMRPRSSAVAASVNDHDAQLRTASRPGSAT